MAKVIVAGSRDIANYFTVCSAIMNSGFIVSEIVSGGARGVDRLGERYAKEFNRTVKQFPANWKEHGRQAGILRNLEMAKYNIASDE
jgi:hypothetical protein